MNTLYSFAPSRLRGENGMVMATTLEQLQEWVNAREGEHLDFKTQFRAVPDPIPARPGQDHKDATCGGSRGYVRNWVAGLEVAKPNSDPIRDQWIREGTMRIDREGVRTERINREGATTRRRGMNRMNTLFSFASSRLRGEIGILNGAFVSLR